MKFTVNINSLEPNANLGFNVQIEADNVLDALDAGVELIKKTIVATGLTKVAAPVALPGPVAQ
jgi:hypothetical protein